MGRILYGYSGLAATLKGTAIRGGAFVQYIDETRLRPNNAISFGVQNQDAKQIQEQLSVITASAQETFAGIRIIKSFGMEATFSAKFQAEGEEYKNRNMKLAKINALFFPMMLLLMGQRINILHPLDILLIHHIHYLVLLVGGLVYNLLLSLLWLFRYVGFHLVWG